MKILLIDNYDSFTFNLYHYLSSLKTNVDVVRNDKITSTEIIKKKYDKIVISPGPGNPNQSGNCLNILKTLHKDIPFLGVCLGHQSIAQSLGGKIIKCEEIVHGKVNKINNDQKGLFKNLPKTFNAARYHSLAVCQNNLPETLDISASTDSGIIMGVRHRNSPIEGIQFHPESIATEYGHKILENFLSL